MKATLHLELYAWEIAQIYHLSAFIFVFLSCPKVCESSILSVSSRNSSSIRAPLDVNSMILTPTISATAHRLTLLSSQEQPSVQFSLETTTNSVNDGFISEFGVHTGNEETPARTTDVLSPQSSLKLDAQIVETTLGSHSAGKALQTENRNTASTEKSGDPQLPTTKVLNVFSTETVLDQVVQTSSLHHNTLKLLSTYDESGVPSKSHVILSSFSFSVIESNMAMSTKENFIALSPSSMASQKVAMTATEPAARDFSVLSSHETFTSSVSTLTSNLQTANDVHNTNNLSPGEGRSKSTFLSHYSAGTSTQLPRLSTSAVQIPLTEVSLTGTSTQLPRLSTSAMLILPTEISSTFTSSTARVSTTVPSSTIAQLSSALRRSSAARVSSSFTASSTARISTSFTSSTRIVKPSSSSTSSSSFKSDSKSSLSTPPIHFTRATTASSFAHITSVQPLLSVSVGAQEKDILSCEINSTNCVCFNCEEARKNGKICCLDLIDMKYIQHGVTMKMVNITIRGFHEKVKAVSQIIAEVVRDSCLENTSLCVTSKMLSDSVVERKKRSPQEKILRINPSSDRVRTKREALRTDMNPYLTNISRMDAIIYSISFKPGNTSNVQTAFYVTVTSLNNGTNQTVAIDGKGLLQILRDKKGTLEDKLNITIDSFTASQKREISTTSSVQNIPKPNPSPGSQNMQTPLSSREGRHLLRTRGLVSKETVVLCRWGVDNECLVYQQS